MMDAKVYGIYGEGRTLCLSCAESYYGNSLEMHLDAGEAQAFSDRDRSKYDFKGLLCDDCFHWIFRPDKPKDPWWLVEPSPEEHLRLLAPFADFLETLKVDVMNLRNLPTV